MSSDLEIKKMILPNLDVNQPVEFSFYESPQSVSYRQYNSNNVSNTSINWSITPPSLTSSVLNKRVLKEHDVTVTITGTAPIGSRLYQNDFFTPRFFPVSSVTQTETVTLNSSFTNSLNVSDILSIMARYGSSYEQLGHEFALCPSQLDNMATPAMMKGTTNSPFNTFNDQVLGVPARNSIPKQVINNPVSTDGVTPITAKLTYKFIEPILVSPHDVDDSANTSKGLANINSYEYYETFTNDLSRMFLFDTLPVGFTYQSFIVNVTGARLLLKWDNLPLSIQPEDNISYSYNIIDIYPTNIGTVNATGLTYTYPSNSVSVDRVAQYMFLGVRPSNSTRTKEQADYFAPIKGVSIKYGNIENQLASATSEQLYEISRKSGLKSTTLSQSMMATYNNINVYGAGGAITQYIGSSCPICLTVPEDIYLSPGISIGTNNKTELLANVTYQPLITTEYTLYIVLVTPAVFTLGSMTTLKSNFMTAEQSLMIPYSQPDDDQLTGNGLYGGKMRLGPGIKHFVKNVYRGVKKHLPSLRTAINVADVLNIPGADVAQLYMSEADRKYRQANEALKKKKGGRLLTNADKMALVRSYKNNYIR